MRWLWLVVVLMVLPTILAVLLSGCNTEPPKPTACDDYRTATYYRVWRNGYGYEQWSGPDTGDICIVKEIKIEPPKRRAIPQG